MNEVINRTDKPPRRRFVALTNIPTPYRLHFYRTLSDELNKRGWSSDVWFMAKTEPNRYWKFREQDFGFPHKFFKGVSPVIRQTTFHINPGVLASLFSDPPDVLLVAGWMLPTNFFGVPIARWRGNCRVFLWVESHPKSSLYDSGVVDYTRRRFFSICDGFAVPGKFSREYVQSKAPDKPAYSLPNIVNEKLLLENLLRLRKQKSSLRAELGVSSANRVLILPARLAVEKAVGPFLECIALLPAQEISRLTILVAGDGPLRGSISDWLASHSQLDIRLLGNLSENDMFRLYAVADAMTLPSLRDPNPLSVIEACWAELPLLLSNHVGNHPEALRHGENGWLFDPKDQESITSALKGFLSTPESDLQRMARISGQIANTGFRSESVIQNFLNDVIF